MPDENTWSSFWTGAFSATGIAAVISALFVGLRKLLGGKSKDHIEQSRTEVENEISIKKARKEEMAQVFDDYRRLLADQKEVFDFQITSLRNDHTRLLQENTDLIIESRRLQAIVKESLLEVQDLKKQIVDLLSQLEILKKQVNGSSHG